MNFRKLLQLALAAAALTAIPGIARAELIPLNLNSSPVISASKVAIDYNATTQVFTASGYADSFRYNDGTGDASYYLSQPEDDVFNFSLTATINSLGQLIGLGSLTITGTVPELHSIDTNSGTLLTGTLSQFGFAAAEDGALEFIFQTTGGTLSGLYPEAGVRITEVGFPASFSNSFHAGGDGLAEVGVLAPTPEPGTIFLFASATALLFFKLRRSKTV